MESGVETALPSRQGQQENSVFLGRVGRWVAGRRNNSEGTYKVWYPETYLSTCCHVCKSLLPKTPKFSCETCRTIFYCSSDHMDLDMEEHEEICQALNAAADILGVTNVFHKAYQLDGDEYKEFKTYLMELCSSALGRPLMPWEEQLCLFPPICATCHRLSSDLDKCPTCEMTQWCCKDHRPRSHGKVCKELLLYREIHRRQQRLLPVLQVNEPPSSVESLSADSVESALLSEIATCPLTIYQVLKLLPDEENLVIHIVGPESQFELSNLRKWDDLLFQFLQGSLTLVFIGPEIGKLPTRRMVNDGRTLQFFFNNCLYHEYDGIKPHMVCFFNPRLYKKICSQDLDSSEETIESLFSTGVPVLITSYTKKEMRADLNKIKEDVPNIQEIVPYQINPFGSRRPHINLAPDESTQLKFKNAYYMLLKADV